MLTGTSVDEEDVPHKIRDIEQREMDRYAKVATGENIINPRAFITPSKEDGVSLTNTKVKHKYGRFYHIYVRYKTEKAIKDDLLGYDWEEGESQMAAQNSEGDTYRYRSLFITFV